MSTRTQIGLALATIAVLMVMIPDAAAAQTPQYQLCVVTDEGQRFLMNFVSQGNAILVSGRAGDDPAPMGPITRSALIAPNNTPFMHIGTTATWATGPTPFASPGQNTVFMVPLPFTGTGITYRASDTNNGIVRTGLATLCPIPTTR